VASNDAIYTLLPCVIKCSIVAVNTNRACEQLEFFLNPSCNKLMNNEYL